MIIKRYSSKENSGLATTSESLTKNSSKYFHKIHKNDAQLTKKLADYELLEHASTDKPLTNFQLILCDAKRIIQQYANHYVNGNVPELTPADYRNILDELHDNKEIANILNITGLKRVSKYSFYSNNQSFNQCLKLMFKFVYVDNI